MFDGLWLKAARGHAAFDQTVAESVVVKVQWNAFAFVIVPGMSGSIP